MSGHSKWSTIKRKKEKTDGARAKIFTKIGREIQVVVREGGSDPASNSRLKDVIAKAKSLNVPSDNINRLIQKASSSDKESYEAVKYEGYGPSGVAFVVDTLTDNIHRTTANVRLYFDKYGAGLGTSGCTAYLFEQKGLIIIEDNDPELEEKIMLAPIEDYKLEDGVFEITVAPSDFGEAVQYMEENEIMSLSSEITNLPTTTVTVEDEGDKKRLEQLMAALDDDDDVQDYSMNLDEPE